MKNFNKIMILGCLILTITSIFYFTSKKPITNKSYAYTMYLSTVGGA